MLLLGTTVFVVSTTFVSQFQLTLEQMTARHGLYEDKGKDGKAAHLETCWTQVEDILLAESLLILPGEEASGL